MEKRVILVNCDKYLINSVVNCIRNELSKNRITKVDVFKSTEAYIETRNYLIVISNFYTDLFSIKGRYCYGICNFSSRMRSFLRKYDYKFLNISEMIEHVVEHEKAIKFISMSIYGTTSLKQMEKNLDVNSIYPLTFYNYGMGIDIFPTYAKLDADTTNLLYNSAEKELSMSLNTNNNNIHIEHMIKKVIFNEPATIVIWNDGTKTIVKAEGEVFDPEKGLAMAISKKVMGNNGKYYNVFKKWTNKYYAKKSD